MFIIYLLPVNVNIGFYILTDFDYFKSNIFSFSITICPDDKSVAGANLSLQGLFDIFKIVWTDFKYWGIEQGRGMAISPSTKRLCKFVRQ